MNANRVMAVDLSDTTEMQPGKARPLFKIRFPRQQPFSGRAAAVFPDGKRFLFLEKRDPPEVRELVVILNWFEDLKRKVR